MYCHIAGIMNEENNGAAEIGLVTPTPSAGQSGGALEQAYTIPCLMMHRFTSPNHQEIVYWFTTFK